MIIFSSDKTIKSLAGNSLPNSHKVLYLIIFSTLYFPSVIISFFQPYIIKTPTFPSNPYLVLINAFLFLTITIIAILQCSKINSQIDGDNFIERFFLLAVPVTIRTLIISMFLLFSIAAIFYGINGSLQKNSNLLQMVLEAASVLLMMFFYYQMLNSFSNLKKLIKTKPVKVERKA